MNKDLSVVVLAAGLGTRMKSDLPKVLHEALGRPMLRYTLDAVEKLKPSKTVVVVGNGADKVKEHVADDRLTFVVQEKLLGTGDALLTARKEIKKGMVLVLNGDCPLITPGTLRTFISKHKRNKNVLSFLSFEDDTMSGYGRIIRDEGGAVKGIVEDKHATSEQRASCNELNGGVYLMESSLLNSLDSIKKNSSSGEYYLTDIVDMVSRAGKKLDAYQCSSEEICGVNNRAELFEVSDILRVRVVSKWMEKGVTFIDPYASFVHVTASIGRDTVIYPNTYIEGSTVIGKNCVILPGVRICDSTIGDGVTIKDNTLIEESRIARGAVIGPFAHLRPGSNIGSRAKIGNFVEIKKSNIGEGSKASHLSYIGDADVGKDVNIGAGTITCNYDGKNKSRTVIESGVFIGSDTQLVAPVKVKKGAYVAAGATVTKDVPEGALAISRSKQVNLLGWAKNKAGKKSENKK